MKKENKPPKKETEVRLRIVLVDPPSGVDFGVQEGKGNDYMTIHKQRSKDGDLTFEFTVMIKDNRDDGLPNFLGPLTYGPLHLHQYRKICRTVRFLLGSSPQDSLGWNHPGNDREGFNEDVVRSPVAWDGQGQ